MFASISLILTSINNYFRALFEMQMMRRGEGGISRGNPASDASQS
jgi:hypothetical protein